MSESYVRLNALRMLVHVGRDKSWQKLSPESLLKKDAMALNSSKIGDEGPEELTVRRLMQDLETSSDMIWKDKGLSRVHKMAQESREDDISWLDSD